MKFTKNSLELCGKEFKFKRCTNKDILEHQKAIEEYQDKFKPVSDKANKIERDIKAIDTEIESIHQYSEAINHKSEPSDDELDKVADMNLDLITLSRKRRKLVEEGEKLDEQHKEDIQNLRNYVHEQYGELASMQLEGLTKEFYIENADDCDATIVRLMGSIKKMLSLGSSSKDVEKFVKDNVNEEAKQSFRRN